MCKARCWRWLFGNKIPISLVPPSFAGKLPAGFLGTRVLLHQRHCFLFRHLFPPPVAAYDLRADKGFFIDNLLVRIHFIIVMIRWTGLAPWEFEFPFPHPQPSEWEQIASSLRRGLYCSSPESGHLWYESRDPKQAVGTYRGTSLIRNSIQGPRHSPTVGSYGEEVPL